MIIAVNSQRKEKETLRREGAQGENIMNYNCMGKVLSTQ